MYTVKSEPAQAFEFEIEGEAYAVPSISSMTLAQARAYAEASKGGGFSFAEWVVDNLFTEEAREAVSRLTIAQLGQLLEAYANFSGVTPGESQA